MRSKYGRPKPCPVLIVINARGVPYTGPPFLPSFLLTIRFHLSPKSPKGLNSIYHLITAGGSSDKSGSLDTSHNFTSNSRIQLTPMKQSFRVKLKKKGVSAQGLWTLLNKFMMIHEINVCKYCHLYLKNEKVYKY
jgi:hypothetical protein